MELLLKAMPIRLDNGFRWNVTMNWSKNNSEVVDLYGDLATLRLGGQWSMNVEARKGEPYGLFFGNGYLEDEQGRWMLDSSGRPQRDTNRSILGNYNPDWLGGIQNRFSYGAFDLSLLVDGQKVGTSSPSRTGSVSTPASSSPPSEAGRMISVIRAS